MSRKSSRFEAVDMGNLYHGVLEIFAEKLKEIGKNWFDFTEEEGERLVDEAVDAYAVTYHHTVLFDSAEKRLYRAADQADFKTDGKRHAVSAQKRQLCAGEVRGFVFGAGGVGCGQYRAF